MNRIEILRQKVCDLYESKNSQRAEWADWLYENHVFLVADESKKLAKRFGANEDLAEAAGMLHDIADAVMSRFDDKHRAESFKIASQFLNESGFTDNEIDTVINDAIKFHGCHDGAAPKTPEGRVMAAADAVVHLSTDFYHHGLQAMKGSKTAEEIRKWALPKIERDYNYKIFFDEIREELKKDYKKAKSLFAIEDD